MPFWSHEQDDLEKSLNLNRIKEFFKMRMNEKEIEKKKYVFDNNL